MVSELGIFFIATSFWKYPATWGWNGSAPAPGSPRIMLTGTDIRFAFVLIGPISFLVRRFLLGPRRLDFSPA